MQGCILYDEKGSIIAITQRISDWKDRDTGWLQEVLKSRMSHGELVEFRNISVYSYIHPVLDDLGQLLGLVELVYDTSPVFSRLMEVSGGTLPSRSGFF